MPFQTLDSYRLDVLIIGGGVAGLWLLDDLRRAGYHAMLVEKTALGSGQTVASQGILHGGLKHALSGRLGAHVDALKEMPDRWRTCLAGLRLPDLSGVRRRANFCYCWRTDSIRGFFGMMGARIGLRISLEPVPDAYRPAPLASCPGTVYRLEEQVVDPGSLVTVLTSKHRERILHGTVRAIHRTSTFIDTVTIRDPDNTTTLTLYPRMLILTAGEGNAALREMCLMKSGSMQRLPLRYLAVSGNLPDLNGFCMDGTKAKAVVTTHRTAQDCAVWQVASETVGDCDPNDFEARVMTQLGEALPAFQWPDVRVCVVNTVRAEAAKPDGSRASDVQILRDENVITAWPTKLVLAPRLADCIRSSLPGPTSGNASIDDTLLRWPHPPVAPYPWTE